MLKRRLVSLTVAATTIGSAPVLSEYTQERSNSGEIEGQGVNNPIAETTPPGQLLHPALQVLHPAGPLFAPAMSIRTYPGTVCGRTAGPST
jgi:hypothetical protein